MNQSNNKDKTLVKIKEESHNKDTDNNINKSYNLNTSPSKINNPNSASKMELK